VLFWLAAWWGNHPWLAWCVVRVELLGHDKFVITGNPQAIFFSGMQYDDFPLVAKKFRAGDRKFHHISCAPPFLKLCRSVSL
jgi:hypothetical protein